MDSAGQLVPGAAPELTAALTGQGFLAGFGSANPITTDNYAAGRCHAYRNPQASPRRIPVASTSLK